MNWVFLIWTKRYEKKTYLNLKPKKKKKKVDWLAKVQTYLGFGTHYIAGTSLQELGLKLGFLYRVIYVTSTRKSCHYSHLHFNWETLCKLNLGLYNSFEHNSSWNNELNLRVSDCDNVLKINRWGLTAPECTVQSIATKTFKQRKKKLDTVWRWPKTISGGNHLP